MGYLWLVFGLFEFFDWCAGKKGLVGNLIFQLLSQLVTNSSSKSFSEIMQNPLLQVVQNPFVAVYMSLLSSFSPLLKRNIQSIALINLPFIVRPWVSKVSLSIQFTCLVFLVYQLREILIGLTEGKVFVPRDDSVTFGSIILLVFLVQFVLRNLPKIEELPLGQNILGSTITGLYALRSDQFVLQESLGTGKLKLLSGHKHEKEKSTQWFIFSKGTGFHGESRSMEIGSLQLAYSWWATVTSNPSQIAISEVSLAGIESLEQFKQRIYLTCTNEFRESIRNQPNCINIERHIEELVLTRSDSFGYTPEIASAQLAKIAILRQEIDRTRTKLLSAGIWEQNVYGGLYRFHFQPESVMLTSTSFERLEAFEQEIKEQIATWYTRTRDKQQFSLQFVDTVTNAMDKVQGVVSRSVQDEVFKGLITSVVNHLESLIPQSTGTEILQKLEEATRDKEMNNDDWS